MVISGSNSPFLSYLTFFVKCKPFSQNEFYLTLHFRSTYVPQNVFLSIF